MIDLQTGFALLMSAFCRFELFGFGEVERPDDYSDQHYEYAESWLNVDCHDQANHDYRTDSKDGCGGIGFGPASTLFVSDEQ